MLFETVFYSVTIYLLLSVFGKTTFSFRSFVYSVFPVSTNGYWFATAYLVMYCLSPFLNLIIKHGDKRSLAALVVFLLAIQCVVNYGIGHITISDIGWFMTLYLLSEYLKRYPLKVLSFSRFSVPVAAASWLVMAVFNIWTSKDFWLMTHLICLICSVSLFASFKNTEIKHNKFINAVAKATFGIYLIHDNQNIRRLLWVDILNCPLHAQSIYFILFACAAVISVFVVCAVIESIRSHLSALLYKLASRLKRPRKIDFLY